MANGKEVKAEVLTQVDKLGSASSTTSEEEGEGEEEEEEERKEWGEWRDPPKAAILNHYACLQKPDLMA